MTFFDSMADLVGQLNGNGQKGCSRLTHSLSKISGYATAIQGRNIGADSTGATGNFAPVLTQEPGQTLRFAPVPFMAVL